MLRIIQIGVGPLGQKLVRFALERPGIEIVAAVDLDPKKNGRDLGEICGLGHLGITVNRDLKSALKMRRADVALLTTVSSLKALEKHIGELAQAKLNIISTCEELVFPWRTQPRIAKRIDRVCRRFKVACVGTGVNPGFLMDYLPCVLSSLCHKISRVKVTRIQDAAKRRVSFQEKIGAGLSRAQFKEKLNQGKIGHVGLVESIYMIAHIMHWNIDRVTENLKPVIAKEPLTSGYIKIEPGAASGIEQIARGYVGRKEVVLLDFRAALGEKESFDCVEINGSPAIKSIIPGGVDGDLATCAIIINTIRSIMNVEPGLKTMLDLPAPAYFHKG